MKIIGRTQQATMMMASRSRMSQFISLSLRNGLLDPLALAGFRLVKVQMPYHGTRNLNPAQKYRLHVI